MKVILFCIFLIASGYAAQTLFIPGDVTEANLENYCLEEEGNNCIHCRSDKSAYGLNILNGDGNHDSSHGLREKNTDYVFEEFNCIANPNSNTDLEHVCDQETKIAHCEVYDRHGVCTDCHCDFGLWWEQGAAGEDGTSSGKFVCIENEFRTRNCHIYNEEKDCQACKNTASDPKYNGFLNGSLGKKNLELDYGLFRFGDQFLCIDNGGDAEGQLKYADLKINLTPHCAEYEYNEDKTQSSCKKCYNQAYFNFDGDNRKINANIHFNEIHFNKWVNSKRIGITYAKNTCLDYPVNYITQPTELFSFTIDTQSGIYVTKNEKKNKDTASKCTENGEKTLLQKDNKVDGTELSPELYGCAPEVENCGKYHFVWDFTTFLARREWYKKYKKCVQCDMGFVLNVDGSSCFQNDSNKLDNCAYTTQTDACSICNNGFYLNQDSICTNTGFFPALTSVEDGDEYDIVNCMTYSTIQNKQDTTKYIVTCSECKFGYVLSKYEETDLVVCAKYNNYAQVKTDRYTLYHDVLETKIEKSDLTKPGCPLVQRKIDASTDGSKTCITGTARYGFSSTGVCASSQKLVPNIRQLCSTATAAVGNTAIQNCDIYSLAFGGNTRCLKCAIAHVLNWSRSRCIPVASETVKIDKCTFQDGVWCRECEVNFILTNENTCVSTPEDFLIEYTDDGSQIKRQIHCEVAEYDDVSDHTKKLTKCQLCKSGYKIANGGVCTGLDECCVVDEDWYKNPATNILGKNNQKLDQTDLMLICPTGEIGGYELDTPYQQQCFKQIDHCRYYRSYQKKRCFECENGYAVEMGGQTCSLATTFGKNILGEKVKIPVAIENCQLYSEKGDICVSCISEYFLEVDPANKEIFKCIQSCTNSEVYLAQVNSLACITTEDENCNNNLNQYEIFHNTVDKELVLRCASCEIDDKNATDPTKNYFLNPADNICTPMSSIIFAVSDVDPTVAKFPDALSPIPDSYLYNKMWSNLGTTTPIFAKDFDSNLFQSPCNTVSTTQDATSKSVYNTRILNDGTKCHIPTTETNENCLKEDEVDGNKCDICYSGFILDTHTKLCKQAYALPFLIEGMRHKDTGLPLTQPDDSNCAYLTRKVGAVSTDTWYDLQKCVRCENGYIRDSNSECQKSPHPACTDVAIGTAECTKCASPYVKTNIGKSCTLNIPDCKKYDLDGKCQTCDFGYGLKKDQIKPFTSILYNICLPLAGGCEEMDFDKSYDDFHKASKVDYCKKCFQTDTYGEKKTVRTPKQGILNNKVGKFCHLGCKGFKRSYGISNRQNNYYNYSCCSGQCDKTQFFQVNSNQCSRSIISNCAEYKDSNKDCAKCTHDQTTYRFLEATGSIATECSYTCNNTDNDCKKVNLTKRPTTSGGNCLCTECNKNNQYVDIDGNCQTNLNCGGENGQAIDATTCSSCHDYLLSYLNGTSKQCVNRTNLTCNDKLTSFIWNPSYPDAQNYSTTSEECVRCEYGYKLNDTTKNCEKPAANDCFVFNIDGSCSICNFTTDSQANGYGLVKQDGTCKLNDAKNKGCRLYNKSVTTFTCIDCYAHDIVDYPTYGNWSGSLQDTVLDYSSKRDSNQICVQSDYCNYGYNDSTSEPKLKATTYCKSCMQKSSDHTRIYYTFKDNTLAQCRTENMDKSNQIKYCRRYADYQDESDVTTEIHCMSCHKGYHSDYNKAADGTPVAGTGQKCIPDDSPCSLPACKNYKKLTKYEYLRCNDCHNQWIFYKEVLTKSAFTLNTYDKNSYTFVCDKVLTYEKASILPEEVSTWEGKDGGVNTSNTDATGDDDDAIIIPDEGDESRETYVDPVIGANILSFIQSIALFCVLGVIIMF